MAWNRALRGRASRPYLPTSHHGEGHLVPKVEFSKRKLHGSLQALRRRKTVISAGWPGTLPAHALLGQSLPKSLPLEGCRVGDGYSQFL